MRPDIEKLKCEICEKEAWVLYPIIFGRAHMFTPRKGVCKECFNNVEELDAALLKKNKKIIEDSINEKTESIKELNQELAELKALDDAVQKGDEQHE